MSMNSMEPFENSENFNEDVGLFEAATHPTKVSFATPSVKVILAAVDGSPRDETVRGYAKQLAARTGARVEELNAAGSAAEVLKVLTDRQVDLLILPVPYGQEYQDLAGDSLGSVVDQLLVKSTCPVLCVREPQDQGEIEEAIDHVLVPLAVADEQVARAVGWGFHVSKAGGRLDLVAVADRDVISEATHLMSETADDPRALDSDRLIRAMLRDIGGIVSAAQKRGRSDDRVVHVETRAGKFIPLTLAELHGRPHLIIWGITRDHSSPAFHRAVDLLLASTGPVLMV